MVTIVNNAARTTANIGSKKIVVDMADKIAQLQPDQTPFLTLMKQIKKDTRVAYAPKFEWLEDELHANTTTLDTAIQSAATTSVVVDTGTGVLFRVNDIIYFPSVGEHMLVTAVSTDTLTVTRGYGTTAAAASISADATIVNLGSAMPENASGRAVLTTVEDAKYNYTQIFRTPVAFSGTEMATKMYGGKDRAYQRKKGGIAHARDIELAMYFGEMKNDTSTTSSPRRTMGGLKYFVGQSNTQAFTNAAGNAPLTYANFIDLVAKQVFRYGSTERTILTGSGLVSKLAGWGTDKLRIMEKENKYGLNIKELVTPYGLCHIVYDPLLDQTGNAGLAFVVDIPNVRYAYLDGRDTKLLVDRQANDVDGAVDEYLTECSLEVKLPKTHMLMTGCNS